MASVEEIAAAIDGTAMQAHLEEFARRVKLSGTAEEAGSFGFSNGACANTASAPRLIRHDAFISLPGAARLMVDGARDPLHHAFHVAAPQPERADRASSSMSAAAARSDFAAATCAAGSCWSTASRPRPLRGAGRRGGRRRDHCTSARTSTSHEMCISPVWGSPEPSTRGASAGNRRRVGERCRWRGAARRWLAARRGRG